MAKVIFEVSSVDEPRRGGPATELCEPAAIFRLEQVG
jgi:hypothetical protein